MNCLFITAGGRKVRVLELVGCSDQPKRYIHLNHFATTEISVMMNAGIQFEKIKKIKGSKVYYVTDTQSEQRNGSKSTRETNLIQKKVIFA